MPHIALDSFLQTTNKEDTENKIVELNNQLRACRDRLVLRGKEAEDVLEIIKRRPECLDETDIPKVVQARHFIELKMDIEAKEKAGVISAIPVVEASPPPLAETETRAPAPEPTEPETPTPTPEPVELASRTVDPGNRVITSKNLKIYRKRDSLPPGHIRIHTAILQVIEQNTCAITPAFASPTIRKMIEKAFPKCDKKINYSAFLSPMVDCHWLESDDIFPEGDTKGHVKNKQYCVRITAAGRDALREQRRAYFQPEQPDLFLIKPTRKRTPKKPKTNA